uniref:hypothetical protein n=1 Tax=Actinotalea sp. TaxID=1872145 RepID=UPI003561EE3F
NRKNLDAARLLLDRDGRTVKQVEAAIDYATTDEFWRANILSMVKLREKYDQLRLHASRAKTHAGATKRTTDDRVADHLALARHLADGADEPTPAQIGA